MITFGQHGFSSTLVRCKIGPARLSRAQRLKHAFLKIVIFSKIIITASVVTSLPPRIHQLTGLIYGWLCAFVNINLLNITVETIPMYGVACSRPNLLFSSRKSDSMPLRNYSILIAILTLLCSSISLAANAPEPTACGIVTGADAQTFIGGPLDVKESARVPTAEGASSYTSICSYLGRGENFQDMLTASRLLDITLHFLDTADATAQIYENSFEQYRQRVNSPDLPFTNATITPINGFGEKAFLLEAVTDTKTGYRSALIVFYKGRVAGSVAAWNKPHSSVEMTKTVLKYIISKLP